MDENIRDLANRLLNAGLDDLPDRERRVLNRIAKRVHISRNINLEFREKLTVGQRLADKVAAFGGSWTFIIIFGAFLAFWVIVNAVMLLTFKSAFDPYPYIFLNLILSMLAAIQAPVIMMAQNRQAAKDRLTASNDYEVNLKAELEIMELHNKIDQIRFEQLGKLMVQQEEQLTMIADLMRRRPDGAA